LNSVGAHLLILIEGARRFVKKPSNKKPAVLPRRVNLMPN
jgi:hypothetical protein